MVRLRSADWTGTGWIEACRHSLVAIFQLENLARFCLSDLQQGERLSVPDRFAAGLAVHGAVLCEHMRSLDWRARKVLYLDRMPDDLLAQVRGVVRTIAGIPK